MSVLTLGEVRKGIAKLRSRDPEGAGALARWLDDLGERFAERVLPVDAAVAERWGELAGAGRTLPVIDGLLAATASARADAGDAGRRRHRRHRGRDPQPLGR